MTSPNTFRGNGSLLSHAPLNSPFATTPLQSQVDGLVGSFTQQATDWRSLASMMAGGMAYRAGRIGVMGLGNGSALRVASVGLGLTAEVSTFELAHRSLESLNASHTGNSNLWRWEGSGGLRQGLLQSFVTFGALKGAGHLAQGENLIAQHLLQDTAMVFGHQASGALGIAPRPTGSLAEQFLQAEATNLQIGAGMALAHGFTPGLQGIERGLHLSLESAERSARRGETPDLPFGAQAALATATGRGGSEARESDRWDLQWPTILHMSGEGDGFKRPSDPSTLSSASGDGKVASEEKSIASGESTIGGENAPTAPTKIDRDAETLVPGPMPEPAPEPAAPQTHDTTPDPASITARDEPTKVSPDTTPDDAPTHRRSDPPARVALEPGEKDFSPRSVREATLLAPGESPAPPRIEIPPPPPDSTGSTTTPEELAKGSGPSPAAAEADPREALTAHLGPKAARKAGEGAEADHPELAEGSPPPARVKKDEPPTRVPRMTPATLWLKDGMLLDGRFQVMELLGSGGFGMVYKVRDTRMDRFVVVKVPRAELDTEDYLPRFKNEIMIQGSLDPRRVVIVYDLITLDNGRVLPVMEYLPGSDLSDVLREDKLSLDQRIDIFNRICEGVDSGHRRRFVHRDLKPGNIRITLTNEVKIMDWGLAKYFGERRRADDTVPEHEEGWEISSALIQNLRENLTVAGAMPGTPGWIAPEVLVDEVRRDDPRSVDIFNLGIILYKMLTNRHPFVDENVRLSLKDHIFSTHPDIMREPPAAENIRPGSMESYIFEVAARALNRNPESRFRSAREMREAVFMAYAQARFDDIRKLREEEDLQAKKMHETWGEYRHDRQILPEQEEGMLDPLYSSRQKRQERTEAIEDLVQYLGQLTATDPAPAARKMIAELSRMRYEDTGDLDRFVRQSMANRIRHYDQATDADVGGTPIPSIKLALDGRLPLEIRAIRYGSGEEIVKGLELSVVPIEELKTGYFLEGAPILQGAYEMIRGDLSFSTGYHVIEVSHPDHAFFRLPFQIGLSQVRQGLLSGKPLQRSLDLIPSRQVPPGFAVVQGGEATIGHNIHRFDDPSFVISYPERRIPFDTFAVSNLTTVGQYRRFIQAQLDRINEAIARNDVEEAFMQAERVRRYLPRDQPQIGSRDLTSDTLENLITHSFEGPRFHWKVQREGDGRDLRFALLEPTSHLSLKQDPILNDQPIHSIPYAAGEAYAEWFYQNLKAQGYEGPPPRLPTVTELEIVTRNSLNWTFPWGHVFRRTFLSSRLSHRDLDKDTYAHPLGTHPFGPEFYRDYSLYQARNEQGETERIVDLLGNVREWTSTHVEVNAVNQFGGSPRTPAGAFFLAWARTYFPKDITDDLHGGFRLVVPFPKITKPNP